MFKTPRFTRSRLLGCVLLALVAPTPPGFAGPRGDTPAVPSAERETYRKLDPRRIAQIESWLPEAPAGVGPDSRDRTAFDDLARRPANAKAVSNAEKLLSTSFPAWVDDDYLDFSRTGQRPRGEAMINARRGRLSPLVWAECLESRGRFLEAIHHALREYLAEPSWTLPAHDGRLTNFRRTSYTVDLASATFGAELAQTVYLLGDRLDPDVREAVRAALRQRIWSPVLNTLRGGAPKHWWLETTNNWNAVCLAGVTGSALAANPDRHERAVLAAAAEVYGRNFVNGFTADGYCSEGIGYWNYGFGHFLLLRSALFSATRGGVDLFAEPKVRAMALFGPRMEVLPGVFPAIADCRFETRAGPALLAYCDRTLGLGLGLAPPSPGGLSARITDSAVYHFGAFPVRAGEKVATAVPNPGRELRSFFPDAGVLVCRPAPGGKLGAVLKGGHNNEHHNHNDVGSFTVALGAGQPVGDPGGPHAYTSETFGPLRYTKFEMFRSRNHPVPLPAGREQSPGRKAAARLLESDFQPARDRYALDLAAAYAVPGLKKMTRTFEFSRVGAGALEVRDEFAFAEASTFETSLTTHGTWKRTGERTLEFTHRGATVTVIIDCPGTFELTEQRIEENAPAFTRVGIKLREKLRAGSFTLVFRPVPAP